MLKVVFFADSHLGFDYPLRPRLTIRRRGPDFFDNFNRILSYAAEKRADLLVHGGDLFFRCRVPAFIVDKVYKAFYNFVNRTRIPVYIVPGNHERSRLPQSLYLAHPLIHIFNKPRHFCFKNKEIQAVLYGFPFFRGDVRSNFKDLLDQCNWQYTDHSQLQLLILHQAVDGARVGPSDYIFRNRQDVIDMCDIPANAVAVLCGHIHRRQVLYSKKVPVIYPGSIERTSFAEKDEQKGFYEIDFIPAPGNTQQSHTCKMKFVVLPARPMFDLNITLLQSKKAMTESILKKSRELPQDSIIRLRFHDNASAYTSIPDLSFLRSILPASFSVQVARPFFKN